ncbi:hypothetical protein D3C81_2186650 [compost metagenome]
MAVIGHLDLETLLGILMSLARVGMPDNEAAILQNAALKKHLYLQHLCQVSNV